MKDLSDFINESILDKSADNYNPLSEFLQVPVVDHYIMISIPDRDKVRRIVFPEGVKKIDCTFGSLFPLLEEVEFPSTLEELGTGVFRGANQLRKAIFHPRSKIEELSDETFMGCEKMEQVELCDSIEVIGARAFSGCESLKEIELPKSLRTINKYSFANCKSMEDLSLRGRKLKDIPSDCFSGLNVKKLILPGVQTIQFDAFRCCPKLEEVDARDCKEISTLSFDPTSCFRLKKLRLARDCRYMENARSTPFTKPDLMRIKNLVVVS